MNIEKEDLLEIVCQDCRGKVAAWYDKKMADFLEEMAEDEARRDHLLRDCLFW